MAMLSKMKTVARFRSWSPSRLDDYDTCPFKAKLKHLDKLCPLCFKGSLKGGFDKPAICTACGKTPVKGAALERGTVIGDALDAYLLGKEKLPPPTTRDHSKLCTIMKKAKEDVKKKIGRVQLSLRVTRQWQIISGDGFDPNAWLYAKLDFLRVIGSSAHVTDWKTGGVDKQTGAVKVVSKYDDQLLTYQVVTLALHRDVQTATADLTFLDARGEDEYGEPNDPVVARPKLTRAGLALAQKTLEKRVAPMFADDSFAPKANFSCRWCDYSKAKGGPCRF